MKVIRNLLNKISKKNIVKIVFILTGIIMYGIFTVISNAFISTQPLQNCAKLWDRTGGYSMVSIFFNELKGMQTEDIAHFEYLLDNELIEQAISAPNENARLYSATYSGSGDVAVYTQRAGSQTFKAYGVEGDFFSFHEYEFISGGAWNKDSVMQDYIVMDKEAAWKMFGAIDVAGMTLEISGNEYIVSGVIESDYGYLAKEGGAEDGMIFVPLSVMNSDTASEITCMEIIFPNPVSGFATKALKEQIDSLVGEDNYVMIENSERYELLPALKRVKKSVNKGMSFNEVAYPYWENAAIGVENITDTLLVLRLIAIIPPAVIVIVSIILFRPIRKLKLAIIKLLKKIQNISIPVRHKEKKRNEEINV